MKKFISITKKISSGQTPRPLAPQQMLHRVVAILILAMTCNAVWAADNSQAKLNVVANNNSYGTVSGGGTSSKEVVNTNATFSVSATANAGYQFDHWEFTQGTGTISNSLSASTEVTVKRSGTKNGTAEYTVQAVFKEIPKLKFYFTAEALLSSTGGGTASVDATSATEETRESSASHTFSFSANANSGYEFIGWSATDGGTIESTNNPYAKTVTNNTENSTVATTLYANFEKLKVYNFAANAIVKPEGYGTATATVEKSQITTRDASASTTATFTVTSVNDGYYWIGWNETESGTTTTEQTVTATLNNSTDGSTVTKTMYAIFGKCADPTSVSANNFEVATGGTYTIPVTLTPSNAYRRLEFTSDNGAIATVDANGIVTGMSVGQANITIKAYKVGSTDFVSTTITATVKEKVATPVISFTPTASNMGETATASITCTTEDATIYYTTDGSIPSNTSTLYNGSFTVNNLDVVKAIAIKGGYYIDSEIATAIYSKHKVATPTINISNGQVSFSCDETGEVTYYYTTDGSTPTTGSTLYTGPFTPTQDECTIKVIATMTGAQNSDVAERTYVVQSGVKGGTVILNDYEDHNLSYYKGLDYTFPDGTTTYREKYKYSIYSPDPRNVKITYRAYDTEYNTIILDGTETSISNINSNSIPKVSAIADESQNTFVYYKTLEKYVIGFFEQQKADNGDWDGTPADTTKVSEQYPYTVISNPFSVRPRAKGSTDLNGYYGFAGWKVISGGDKILEYSNNDVIPLDAIIHFTGMKEGYTPNCTSAVVVLEATWAPATVKTGTGPQSFDGGTYETNFIVASGDMNGTTIEQGSPCTIMAAYYPDGTANTNRTISRLTVTTNGSTPATNTVKVEWIRHGSGTFDAYNHNMILGRGITSTTQQGTIYGAHVDNTFSNTVKIESGNYSTVNPYHIAVSAGNDINCYMIFGCDYDRAKADYYNQDENTNSYNAKLKINSITANSGSELNRRNGQLYFRTLFKSGIFNSQYYSHYASHLGQRFATLEGGYFKNNITGGSETDLTQPNARSFTLRGKGTFRIDGRIAGGSTQNNCSGNRCLVLTGGRIGGWVAAGSNSNQTTGGVTTGESFVYVGGNVEVNSRQFGASGTTLFNTSTGGVVYGAGCGINHNSTSGAMTRGSNVVLADNAFVERGVYGGGAMGRIYEGQGSNIFVLGGHVGKGTGTITDSANPAGQQNVTVNMTGVFGGACNVGGGSSNIYMNGGLVEGGIFGGSNITGTMDNDVRIQIDGGQVGTNTETANVHGGGYGQSTVISGNVNITIGKENATEGATIYGDVYGGSALGTVNDAATDHTNVTLNAGTINGSLYGGALGSETIAANVYGPVQVTVNGGTVNTTSASGSGAVYGCNNINGAPQSTVKVDIYGTDPAPSAEAFALDAVYGGGNMAHYAAGTPVVVIHNCDNSIGSVYGGGNAADITNGDTDVTIWGGNVIGKVFGGGNGEREGTQANISGGTNVTIHGGTILEVYGGSNTRGTIGGTINVNVNAQAEEGHDTCPIDIDNVYGGGNKAASNAGNVSIGCAEHIGAVYGGANQANVTGDIDLSITSGHIDNVFGGNNNSGEISGSITVTVHDSGNTCGMAIGNVFGAGNLATYGNGGNYPVVNILNGTISGNVFGGGKGDATDNTHTMGSVTGNPQVTIGDYEADHHVIIKGDVYGGGDAAKVEGTPSVTINDCDTQIGVIEGDVKSSGTVYGGGNAAPVTGTNVTVNSGQIYNVFGGGHGDIADNISADVNGNVSMLIKGGTIDKVFAGSNAKGAISGSSTLEINKPSDGTCEMHITEVYGGGNQAAGNAGTVSIVNTGGETEGIQDVYGGAREANVTSAISLNITGGNINRVFGGNNISGSISGAISVNVNWSGTGYRKLGSVYGGGNLAPYTGSPTVNVVNATTTGSVFGGGLGKPAVVVGDPIVNIGSWTEGTAIIGGNVFGGGDEAAVEGNPTVTIRDCDTEIRGDLYGGGNAAPVYSTNTTMWGGTVYGNVFGGGNGSDATKNPKGAQVGYTRNDETTAGSGNAVTNIYGGTIGTWSGDPAACAANTGGIFGGSNTTGNINGKVMLTLDQRTCTETGAAACPLVLSEVYGSGNNAAYAGTGIDFNLGCVSSLDEIYGGAKNADMTGDIHLTISSGRYKRVFAGNNLGGNIKGSIKVTIEETGCEPVRIGELYGGGNMAIYSVYGYNSDNTPITSGTPIYNAPEVNVYSCTSIGTVFGGGLGLTADEINALPEAEREAAKEKGKTYGDTHVNISMIPGIHAATALGDANKIGVIGEVFGGGNASDVAGDTYVNIGTLETVTLTTGDEDHKDKTFDVKGVNVSGNVYGGGNAAHVTGKTHVQVGRPKD